MIEFNQLMKFSLLLLLLILNVKKYQMFQKYEILYLLLLAIVEFCWDCADEFELASGCVRLSCEFTDLLGQAGSDMCEFCKDVCGSDCVRTGFRRLSDFERVIRVKQIVCYNTNQNIKVCHLYLVYYC